MKVLEKNNLFVFTDGACRGNPGPSSIGVSICNSTGDELHTIKKTLGTKTNNEAEYIAVLEAFKYLKEEEVESFTLKADSQLLIKQLTGEYKIKAANLKKIALQILEIAKSFDKVNYEHVRREYNKRADELANMALDGF